MSFFFLLPTTDIHLVTNASISGGSSFAFKMQDSSDADITNDTNNSYDGYNASIATISNGNITAVAVGQTIARVKHLFTGSPSSTHQCFVRISVHADISKIWIGNDQISLYGNGSVSPGKIVTVYAKFTDGTIADITSHPYLSYTSLDGKVTVGSDGSLSTTNTSGTSTLKVQISGTTLFDQVTINIKGDFTADRQIVKREHKGGNPIRTNILFLSEGFQNESDFRAYLKVVIDNLLTNPTYSPFHLLADSIDIWSAFEPSPQNGATVANPISHDTTTSEYSFIPNAITPTSVRRALTSSQYNVYNLVSLVGLPYPGNMPTTVSAANTLWSSVSGYVGAKLTQNVLDAWNSQNTIRGFFQVKDTIFGMLIGDRFGDMNMSMPYDSSVFPISWYQQPTQQQRDIRFDRRAYNASNNGIVATSWFNQYLKTLKMAGVPNTDPEYNIGNKWTLNKPDAGLVGVIVNHSYSSGLNQQIPSPNRLGLFASSIGQRLDYDVVFTDALNLDKLTNDVITLSPQNELDFCSTYAHELLHAVRIGDEYAEIQPTTIISSTEEDTINTSPNLMTFDKVQLTGGSGKQIDPAKIKWNWPRTILSSKISSMGQYTSGTDYITRISVQPDQIGKWKNIKAAKDASGNPVDVKVFLRSADLVANQPYYFKDFVFDKIDSIDDVNNTVSFRSSSVATAPDFADGWVGGGMYVPYRSNGDNYNMSAEIIRLINPRVYEYLRVNKTSFAVKPTTGWNMNSLQPEFPEKDATINAVTPPSYYSKPFQSPFFKFLVIGLYEGGGYWNSQVYRPTGFSILRDQTFDRTNLSVSAYFSDPQYNLMPSIIHAPFSFPLKYYVLAKINSTLLETLDSVEYKDADRS